MTEKTLQFSSHLSRHLGIYLHITCIFPLHKISSPKLEFHTKQRSYFLHWKRNTPGDAVLAMQLPRWLLLVFGLGNWRSGVPCYLSYSCTYCLSTVACAWSSKWTTGNILMRLLTGNYTLFTGMHIKNYLICMSYLGCIICKKTWTMKDTKKWWGSQFSQWINL